MGGGSSTTPASLRWRGWPVPAPYPGDDPQSIHRGVPHCREEQAHVTALYWPDLKSSVSPIQHEFVADILNINDSAHEPQAALLRRWSCTKAPAEHCGGAKHCLFRLLSRTSPLLTGSFTAWKAALALFSPSEDINSYSGQIRNWKRQ